MCVISFFSELVRKRFNKPTFSNFKRSCSRMSMMSSGDNSKTTIWCCKKYREVLTNKVMAETRGRGTKMRSMGPVWQNRDNAADKYCHMYNASYLMSSTDVQRIPTQRNVTHVPAVTNTAKVLQKSKIFGAMGNTQKKIKNNTWNKNRAEKVQYLNTVSNQQHQLMPSYKTRG